jgi:hypothetical protein
MFKSGTKIQKSFLSWLSVNHNKFLIPVKIGQRDKTLLEFSFEGITSHIRPALNLYEIGLYVYHQKQIWDSFEFLECRISSNFTSYYCSMCKGEAAEPLRYFLTPEELWIDHIFEPLLEWVNTKLYPASWLPLYGNNRSSTFAELRNDFPSEYLNAANYSIIPLRI